jgi:ferritin-like metal-binding protein YciE
MSLIAVQTTTYEVARFHLMLHNANISGYEDALNYFTKIINEEEIRINKVKEEE